MRRSVPLLASVALVAATLPFAVAGAAADSAPAGELSQLIIPAGTDPGCFTAQFTPPADEPGYRCPPAAMAVADLPNGHQLFWDGLEGMNRVDYNVVAEFGDVAQDDQSRVADFAPFGPAGGTLTPATPTNETAAPTGGNSDPANSLLPGGAGVYDSPGNDYDLFCSPLVQLADGTLLAAGGTHYYLEPGVQNPVDGKGYGVSELQGLKATRIYDPRTDSWANAPGNSDMHFGRWYPTLVTLADGHVFVASGVTKLIKPAYTDRAPQDSGRNVVQTETYDPATYTWTLNHSDQPGTNPLLADGSQQSLPLFPRLHLLPDGHVYYDAAGQTFNPDGQAYDEASWLNAKVYDPADETWRDLSADTPTGLPLVDGQPVGFRGSGFDVMLPLTPTDGYTKARILNGGGVVGPTPGGYVADKSTTINTVDTGNGDALTSASGPDLLNARWYGDAVVLPDGNVFVTNGATRDEVVGPGTGNPVFQTELLDMNSSQPHAVAGPSLDADHGRTYHNSAILLPDGRVLIGGHAPIATGYAMQSDAGSAAGLSKPEADSTFQIYSPPYLSYDRPEIESADTTVDYDRPFVITTGENASDITKVVLVRNPSQTHLTDGDQRSVELAITGASGDAVTVQVPGRKVLPPGPYLLYVERSRTADEAAAHPDDTVTTFIPSVGKQVFVGAPAPDYINDDNPPQGSGVTASVAATSTTAAHPEAGRAAVAKRLAATRPAATASRVQQLAAVPAAAVVTRSSTPWQLVAGAGVVAAVVLFGPVAARRRRHRHRHRHRRRPAPA